MEENTNADPTLYVRQYSAELAAGDGRTVDARIVPYGVKAIAADGGSGQPVGIPYNETFVRGAFDHQLNAPNRVILNFEHEGGVAGIVGKGTMLRAADDGLYGSFKLLNTPNGDTALELVKEGVLGSVSMEFFPVRSVRGKDGTIQRVKANLKNVALCRVPAYAGADVLALREAPAIELGEECAPLPELDPALLERMVALGIKLPEHLRTQDDKDRDAARIDALVSQYGK